MVRMEEIFPTNFRVYGSKCITRRNARVISMAHTWMSKKLFYESPYTVTGSKAKAVCRPREST